MRFRPANIRVIHRRCRSADQMTGADKKTPALDTRAGLPENHRSEPIVELTQVFPYQKPEYQCTKQGQRNSTALPSRTRPFGRTLQSAAGQGTSMSGRRRPTVMPSLPFATSRGFDGRETATLQRRRSLATLISESLGRRPRVQNQRNWRDGGRRHRPNEQEAAVARDRVS